MLLLLFSVRATYRMYQAYQASSRELARLREEEAVLNDRLAYLEAREEQLSSERGIEEEIRKRFSVVREGEHMVLLIDDATKTPEVKNPFIPRPWWKRILGW